MRQIDTGDTLTLRDLTGATKSIYMKILLALFCLAASWAHAASRPNVIVFLVDDMGWMDTGAYGSQYYETPRIDAFAAKSMRFTKAYAQPLCSPTRCSLLTGQYTARHGLTSATGHQPPQPPDFNFLPPSDKPMLIPVSKNYMEPAQYTLAEALRDAGYRTAHIGKWHLGITQPHWPEQQGFDVTWHCHPDPGPPGNYFSPYGVVADGKPGGRTKVGNITDGPDGEYIVDRLADEAIKFIESSKDRPFFLNLWNYGVHGPWGHKVEYTKLFVNKKDPRGLQGNPIMASMIKSVDECFGRVLDSLEKNGLANNTIIIFNSDNGGNSHSNTHDDDRDARKAAKSDTVPGNDWKKWAGNQPPTINTPLRGDKNTLYEGGTRVPLIWSWRGQIKGGATTDAVVGPIDLYPTLLDLLGIPQRATQKIDGVSYASVLKQTGNIERKAYFNYHPGGNSVRAGGVSAVSGHWKLIRWFGFQPGDAQRHELYSLQDDLSETKNLAIEHPDKVKELDAQIDAFLIDTGALYPRPNPDFKGVPPRPRTSATADPLGGLKERGCKITIADDGIAHITAVGNQPSAFLGYAARNLTGLATLTLKLRRAEKGEGKLERYPKTSNESEGMTSTPFAIAGGPEWQVLKIAIPSTAPLGTLRLHLPLPIDIDEMELLPETGKSVRWEFSKP